MLLDEEGEVLKDKDNMGMQIGCNKKENAHNDLRYSDSGVKSTDDSADPQLPTATFTVGLSRTIPFEPIKNIVSQGKGIVSWSKTGPNFFVKSELDDESIFVLELSNDK